LNNALEKGKQGEKSEPDRTGSIIVIPSRTGIERDDLDQSKVLEDPAVCRTPHLNLSIGLSVIAAISRQNFLGAEELDA
jgi:hypothetical protein